MTEQGEHFCTGCGESHGGEQRTSPEVEIARINAKRDVEIARMEYREAQEGAALAAETDVVVTEMETAASVAVAEATDPPEAADGEDGNQSIIVEGPPAEAPEEPEPSMSPKDDSEIPGPETPRKSTGYWG